MADVVLTADAFTGRLRKASSLVRQRLDVPDVLVVQEVENRATVERLADAINADAAAASRAGVRCEGFLEEGNDPGGIDLGVLVNRATVPVVDVRQVGRTDVFINPRTGTSELLHDRPPLVVKAALVSATGPGSPTRSTGRNCSCALCLMRSMVLSDGCPARAMTIVSDPWVLISASATPEASMRLRMTSTAW